MGGFKFGSGQSSGDNYLNKLTQTVAETEESQIRQVINTFPKTGDNLIVFGVTLKGIQHPSDAELRDNFESHFKTMYEMYDREQVFNSSNKYCFGASIQ